MEERERVEVEEEIFNRFFVAYLFGHDDNSFDRHLYIAEVAFERQDLKEADEQLRLIGF